MNIRKIILSTALLATVAGGAAVIHSEKATADFDINGLNSQVQNHEARLGNLENRANQDETQINQNAADIGSVQKATGTAPAPAVQPVSVPVQTQPAPVAPIVAARTILSHSYASKLNAQTGQYDVYDMISYSDGSSETVLVGTCPTAALCISN